MRTRMAHVRRVPLSNLQAVGGLANPWDQGSLAFGVLHRGKPSYVHNVSGADPQTPDIVSTLIGLRQENLWVLKAEENSPIDHGARGVVVNWPCVYVSDNRTDVDFPDGSGGPELFRTEHWFFSLAGDSGSIGSGWKDPNGAFHRKITINQTGGFGG